MLKGKGKLLTLISIGLILVLSLLTIGGCSSKSSSSSTQTPTEKVIELKVNLPNNATSSLGRTWQYFADELGKRTNGRVKVTVYPGGTLTPPDKVIDGISSGISDIGFITPNYTPGRFPATEASLQSLPFDSAWSFTHAVNDWYNEFKPKEYEKFKMIAATSCGAYILATKDKPVRKPEDIKGLKVRVSGGSATEYVKALGGVPVAVPMGEAYEAMSKGVVDAILAPFETQKAFKHAEVAKYITVLPLSFGGPTMGLMNIEKYNALPDDIKKIVDEVSSEMVEALAKAWWYGDIVGEEFFLSLGDGREIIQIPAAEIPNWEKLISPLVDKYIVDGTAKGFPSADYIKYLRERTDYWNKQPHDKKEAQDWVTKNIYKQ